MVNAAQILLIDQNVMAVRIFCESIKKMFTQVAFWLKKNEYICHVNTCDGNWMQEMPSRIYPLKVIARNTMTHIYVIKALDMLIYLLIC